MPTNEEREDALATLLASLQQRTNEIDTSIVTASEQANIATEAAEGAEAAKDRVLFELAAAEQAGAAIQDTIATVDSLYQNTLTAADLAADAYDGAVDAKLEAQVFSSNSGASATASANSATASANSATAAANNATSAANNAAATAQILVDTQNELSVARAYAQAFYYAVASLPDTLNPGSTYDLGLLSGDIDLSTITFANVEAISVLTCEIWLKTPTYTGFTITWPDSMVWVDTDDGTAPNLEVNFKYAFTIRKCPDGVLEASVAYRRNL